MQEPTIGQRLKSARESKNISLEEANRATRIHINILSSLEEDKFSEILNPIYVKSFLRRYSHYLGLPQDEILKDYTALNATKPEQVLTINKPRKASRPKANFKSLAMPTAIILSLAILISFIAIVKPARYLSRIKFPKREAAATPKKEEPLLVPKKEVLKLTVKAADDSWMHVKCDGKIVFQNILQKGTKETWQANDKIELWVGNAAALDLNLNGHPLGSPGRGVIKNILVTREGMSKEK